MRTIRTAALLVLLAAPACSGPTEGPVPEVDRETFVEVYVALRAAALERPGRRLPDAERAAILDRFGVTTEGLLAFAEFYGRQPEVMDGIWTEVEERLGELMAEPDTIG